MKKITTIKKITIFVGLLILTMLTACSPIQAMPQELATSTQKIINEVKETDISVFEKIQHNIELVSNLRDKVESSEKVDKDKLLNEVIRELEKVATSYTELANQKDSIRKSLGLKITAIEDLSSKVQSEIARLTELRNDYRAQMQIAALDSNPDIVRTRRASLSQAIEYVDMQIQLWQEFSSTENDIRLETANVQQRIDSFLSAIDSSAILFREGLNLLKLQRDISEALSLFTTDMPKIEQLSRDMEQSWSQLDMLINALTSMSGEITIKK